MKSYAKLFLFLAIVGIASLLVSMLITPLLGFPFHKILRRSATLIGIIGAGIFWRVFFGRRLADLGLGKPKGWVRNLAIGFSLGIAAISLYAVCAMAFGLFKLELHRLNREFLFTAALSLPAAFLIGAIEEFFFRGVIMHALLEKSSRTLCILTTNLFYALVHLREPFQLINEWPRLLGLFILGITLSYGYFRTGSLYLSIGLHAGFVYAIKLRKYLFADFPANLQWLFGDKWLVGGAVNWVVLGLIILLIRVLPLKTNYGRN